jgi:hypothetical protein
MMIFSSSALLVFHCAKIVHRHHENQISRADEAFTDYSALFAARPRSIRVKPIRRDSNRRLRLPNAATFHQHAQ